MPISSRTPEGEGNRCPVCGHVLRLEPSRPPGDAPCPRCGTLLWFRDDHSVQQPIGQKQYSAIKGSERIAGRLPDERVGEPAHAFAQVTRAQEKFVVALLKSPVYRKFEQNQKSELGFGDACRFWNMTLLQGEAVDQRLEEMELRLNEMEQALAQKAGRVSNGRIITADDIRVLRNIHRYMEDRFDRMLNLLRSRIPPAT